MRTQPHIKNCPRCAVSNEFAAHFCFACGSPMQKKSYWWAVILIFSAFIVFVGFIALLVIGVRRDSRVKVNRTQQPAYSPGPGAVWVSPIPTSTPRDQLVVVKSHWEKDGFGTVAVWRITFKNNSDQPIGDIQYRTTYYSETGNLVDKGGIDSPLDKKVIQKVIPPKSTRTVEVNDGFTHSEANRARFELVDWRIVTDRR